MRITALPRNINRAREIVSVLIKYGLAAGINRLDLEFAKDLLKDRMGEGLARHTAEARIRMALTELGPTFIKLGQVLSTRPDVVGIALAEELTRLQADVPADAPDSVRATIESELRRPVNEMFVEFDERPVASASIGQVHRARLPDGSVVAIKVQHRGIEDKMRVDLDILVAAAEWVEQYPEQFPGLRNYRPRATVIEFQRTLNRELDFRRELRNMQQFTSDFAQDKRIHIPRVYPELTTGRVLVMEFLEGIKLADTTQLVGKGYDRAALARRGADLYMEMIFTHGFYHADPHPGNLLVLDHDQIGLLDFGMVGRIDELLLEEIEEGLLAITSRDPMRLTSVITRIGAMPPNLDPSALALDVTDFVNHYTTQPLEEVSIGQALSELTELIRRYQIMLPARLAMLIKVLVMLDGTSKLLSPHFQLSEVFAPYQRRLMWRRMSPARRLRKLRRVTTDLEHLIRVLPRGLTEIFEQVQTGKFDVHLDHRGLEPSVNRLVLGLLASALFVGSTAMLSAQVLSIRSVSIPGALGVALSLMLGMRLLRAINKSGHLDRRG